MKQVLYGDGIDSFQFLAQIEKKQKRKRKEKIRKNRF